jgi:hypothetical protein|tara:strand:- start:2668 stop:3057 length:390 start_codon:yes stop_codon:yes gene_type:complete
MATHVGTSGVVKVGANTVAEVTGFTLNETQDTVEDTSLTDSKKSYIALRGDATATIEAHWDETDTNGQEALDVGTSATIELYPEGADSGDAYYTGTGIVTGADVAVTMDGIISRTLNIQFSGGVTHTTV